MRKDILVKLVKEEARKLRKEATKDEISKLNLRYLSPAMSSSCIYGQMTGHCLSARAHYLINKCAPRIYHNEKVNGKPNFETNNLILTNQRTKAGAFFVTLSPVELFIMREKNQEENCSILINYLKGKTNTLKFKPF